MEDRVMPYESVRCLGHGPVLVLAPHGDDEVFGCAGAILRHVEAGDSVRVIVVTDGAADLPNAAAPAAYIREREEESRVAGRLLGYGEPEFWRLPDRSLQYGESLVQRVTSVVREASANLIYAPSVLEMHPDHRALGMVAIEAIRRVGGDCWLAMYEIGVPLRPNRLLDITDIRDHKREAMKLFASQMARRDYAKYVEALNCFRAYTLPPDVESAEAYYLASQEDIRRDPMALYTSEARRAQALGFPLDQQEQPLLSVIVRSIGRPVLQEALDSLALQTYPNIEVIVVDALGQGHLPLPVWCGRFPLRQLATGESLPRSRAANLGMDAANGEYIAFLDDDDLLDPDHFPALVERLVNQPLIRAAYAGVRVIDMAPAAREDVINIFHEPFNARRLVYENYIPIHAVLFHKSLRDAGCRFDESLNVYEDWDFWLQLAQRTAFGVVDQVSATYRSSGGSGVGLLHEQREEVLENRHRLYTKWLGRWDSSALDSIFDEYRQVRHEQTMLHQKLLQRTELCNLLEQGRRELGEKYEILRGEYEALHQDHAQISSRLHDLEFERGQRLSVRCYRVVRKWRVMAPVFRIVSLLQARR